MDTNTLISAGILAVGIISAVYGLISGYRKGKRSVEVKTVDEEKNS